MTLSKMVAAVVVFGLFSFGVCEIQSAHSFPNSLQVRADQLRQRIKERKHAIKDRFRPDPHPNPQIPIFVVPFRCGSGSSGFAGDGSLVVSSVFVDAAGGDPADGFSVYISSPGTSPRPPLAKFPNGTFTFSVSNLPAGDNGNLAVQLQTQDQSGINHLFNSKIPLVNGPVSINTNTLGDGNSPNLIIITIENTISDVQFSNFQYSGQPVDGDLISQDVCGFGPDQPN